jgi:phosphotransferase system enzyme I (PtsI)
MQHPITKATEPKTTPKAEKILKGIPSSLGYAIGTAYVIGDKTQLQNLSTHRHPIAVDEEIERFRTAIEQYSMELEKYAQAIQRESKQVYSIIETLQLLVHDESLIEGITQKIREGNPVEVAIQIVFDQYLQTIISIKDKLFREKAIELEQLRDQMLEILANKRFFSDIPPNSIVVAKTVSPEQVIVFKHNGICGIITEIGGLTTHSSILARSLEIPEVIGVANATNEISTGDAVAIDGYKGLIVVNYTQKTFQTLTRQIQEENELKAKLGDLLHVPSQTKDKKRIALQINLNFLDELDNQIVFYSDGVGLVRTEHLIEFPQNLSSKEMQDFEEYQYNRYKDVVHKIYPKPVIFRVFDLGGDKFYSIFKITENNPMLGLRGIRFLLANPKLFKSQLRALLRASAEKNLKIMLPMITTVQEVKESINLLNVCKMELLTEGEIFDQEVELGAMIETPAAALQADVISKYVDFLSIGTNDLTQYTVVADRDNQYVVNYFDPFHPSVLKLMQIAVEGAKKHKIPIGICGELASHPSATEILIGLGLDSISVSPPNFLPVKKWISEIEYHKAVRTTQKILELETFDEIRKQLAIF